MPHILHLLTIQEWWTYNPRDSLLSQVYHWFNLFEGCAWILIAVLVLRRYLRHKNSKLELLYSFAFFVFGLSDFVEAYRLRTWLILGKGVVLFAIIALRSYLLKRHYPDAKAF